MDEIHILIPPGVLFDNFAKNMIIKYADHIYSDSGWYWVHIIRETSLIRSNLRSDSFLPYSVIAYLLETNSECSKSMTRYGTGGYASNPFKFEMTFGPHSNISNCWIRDLIKEASYVSLEDACYHESIMKDQLAIPLTDELKYTKHLITIKDIQSGRLTEGGYSAFDS